MKGGCGRSRRRSLLSRIPKRAVRAVDDAGFATRYPGTNERSASAGNQGGTADLLQARPSTDLSGLPGTLTRTQGSARQRRALVEKANVKR